MAATMIWYGNSGTPPPPPVVLDAELCCVVEVVELLDVVEVVEVVEVMDDVDDVVEVVEVDVDDEGITTETEFEPKLAT